MIINLVSQDYVVDGEEEDLWLYDWYKLKQTEGGGEVEVVKMDVGEGAEMETVVSCLYPIFTTSHIYKTLTWTLTW